jgi:tetratricopeptide (TPR) repeat protein
MLCLTVQAEPDSGWSLVRSSHFEVYSQAGEMRGRAALLWFEQLHAFFEQSGMNQPATAPVRVIGFRSVKEYGAYRLRPSADAYYIGTENRDYIVMPSLAPGDFPIAAHEYVHEVLHRNGKKFPLWLNEGLAEFFSTLRIGEKGCEIGGDLPAHSQILQRRAWAPFSELLAITADSLSMRGREEKELVYAQSWALTEMLALSPEYASRFLELMAGKRTFASLYGRSLEAITKDVHAWIADRKFARATLPGISVRAIMPEASELPPFAARKLMAELLAAMGELDRAEAAYRDLAHESPGNPEVQAAAGMIAMRKGDRQKAREAWKFAIDEGVADAGLCYRYAMLAQEAGLKTDEIRPALERAVALKPDFDDARYSLGLMESNAGEYEAALVQLRAMKTVTSGRAYGYWVAVAYALTQLDRRDEAKAATQEAMKHAASAAERKRASELAYMTETDVAVQFTRDANGQPQLVMTRIPHGSRNWNPFIEQRDDIRRVEGQLRTIECGNNKITAMGVDTAHGSLRLAVPDPSRVLMRNAPAEFLCGQQSAQAVQIEYAISKEGADGILRGMEFR